MAAEENRVRYMQNFKDLPATCGKFPLLEDLVSFVTRARLAAPQACQASPCMHCRALAVPLLL